MNDPTPNRPPLWQVMADAYIIAHASGNVAHAYAAELRAIADEIDARIYSDQPVEAVVELLRAEADRAEAGVTGTVSFDTEDGTVVLKASQIEFIPPE